MVFCLDTTSFHKNFGFPIFEVFFLVFYIIDSSHMTSLAVHITSLAFCNQVMFFVFIFSFNMYLFVIFWMDACHRGFELLSKGTDLLFSIPSESFSWLFNQIL